MNTAACEACPAHAQLARMGIDAAGSDHVVALAGNPNTGKSSVFNALTGLRQHVGNWSGKTVTRAEGGFGFGGKRYKLVDLPGTYSLLSASQDEEISRNFLLFGQPDCTVVVTDATALERNLNLVLQVLEITDRVVVCVNLMDEAQRKGLEVDVRSLSRDLGVPTVPTVARSKQGMAELASTVAAVISGEIQTSPLRVEHPAQVSDAIEGLVPLIDELLPGLPNARWVALRLLDGDHRVQEALLSGELAEVANSQRQEPADRSGGSEALVASRQGELQAEAQAILNRSDQLRRQLGGRFRDRMVEALYQNAQQVASRSVKESGAARWDFDQRIDRLVTSRSLGLPLMLLLLGAVFWVTILGANVPSQMLANAFFAIEETAAAWFGELGAPWWLTGFMWHGVFRGLAWVVSVMLPPMAIFFPVFTILEDLGYLPRVAFNLDWLFRKAGAHGKQALTMAMGFGCNAAGVTSTRIIDSPRERLLAILTNNFVPCNGRFPTLIMLAVIFVAAAFPPAVASFAAAGAVVAVVLLGVGFTLAVSWALSRTVLSGEASAFTLELPPYRRPSILRILYTSLIDRTIFVLGRAILTAAPAGAVIWLLANIDVGGASLSAHAIRSLGPLGEAVGLDGVILLAYVIAIPANEIVVPTMLMCYLGGSMMMDVTTYEQIRTVLVGQHGWTLLTAVNLMLFSLLHNPCATTILTIWKETRSPRWTTLGALMPLSIAFLVCLLTAQASRLLI